MKTLEELHAHYKAVRQRLDNPVVKKPTLKLVGHLEPIAIPEPEPAPPPKPIFLPSVSTPTPARIILNEVAEKYELSVADIRGVCRKRKFSRARQEAAYRLSVELKFSLSQVGRMIGNKDHTTALHAIRKHKKILVEGYEPKTRKSCVSSTHVTQVEPQVQSHHELF